MPTPPRADLVVHGGIVVNADGAHPATVIVRAGRVVGLADPDLPPPSHERTLDAHGQLVIPGGVDPHCHIGQRLGNYQGLDDYETASIAALCGGTTTIIDFAIPPAGRSPLDEVRSRRQLAEISRCDIALHGCVTAWDDTTADQIAVMAAEGVRTIKMFTTYRDVVMAGPDTVLEVMRSLRANSGLAYIHAEANHLIEDAQTQAAATAHSDARHLPQTRPELAEAAAVAQVLAIAEHVGAPVYFVHQTTPASIDLIRAARRRGVRAYTETCPHYLALDDGRYQGEHPERYVCCPPLRSASTVSTLHARVLAGEVDTLGSDHCCFSTAQKTEHSHDVTEMPNGMPGVETRLPVAYTQLVVRDGLPIERFVALFATNPARLNGLSGKGAITVGNDADLVVLDPHSTRTVANQDLHMATDYSPYEGLVLTGWPSAVVSGGRVVWDADGFHDPGAIGRTLHADPLAEHLLT